MQIPLIGWISIVCGFILFFERPRWLYYLMIFFIPFSGISVLNIPQYGLSFLLPMWFAFLWFISVLLKKIKSRNLNIKIPPLIFGVLLLFSVVVFISLWMPLFINGNLAVWSQDHHSFEPLDFELSYFINFLMVLIGSFLCIFIADNINPEVLKNSFKAYMLGGFTAAIIGIMELVCYYAKIANPFYFFSTALSSYLGARIVNEGLGGHAIPRIASVSEEPSFFAIHLLCAFSILIFTMTGGKKIFSRRIDAIFLGLFGAVLLLSTSTTAYFGLFFIFIALLYYKKAAKTFFIGVLLFLALSLLAKLFFPVLYSFINSHIFRKLATESGSMRILTLRQGWSYFLGFPILGIGLGVTAVNDLIIKLLSGTGIIGFSAFSFLIWVVLSRLKRCASITSLVLFVTVLVFLVVSEFAEFQYKLVDFWFLLGMAAAYPRIYKQNLANENHSD